VSTAILTDPDGTCGITVLDDGTRIYWGEDTFVTVRLPDGSVQRDVDLSDRYADHQGRYDLRGGCWVCRLEGVEAEGANEHRTWSDAEQSEWEAARHRGLHHTFPPGTIFRIPN
jgi:hypothetical protein